MKRYYTFIGLLVIVAVVATIVQSQMGKGVKGDQDLTQKISDFDSTVQDYALSHDVLPLASQVSVPGRVTYTLTGRTTYKLCGTFLTVNNDPNPGTNVNVNVPDTIDASHHGKGYQCFNGSVDLPDPVIQPAPKPSASPTPHPIIRGSGA